MLCPSGRCILWSGEDAAVQVEDTKCLVKKHKLHVNEVPVAIKDV